MPQTFKIGDTVRLKSGGPLMTIVEAEPDNHGNWVWCEWFHNNDKKGPVKFPAEAVEAA